MKLLSIFEALELDEASMRVEIDTSPFPVGVAINPSRREVIALLERTSKGEMRGLLDMDKDKVYMWDAYRATHMDIVEAIGLRMYNELVITKILPANKMRSVSMDHSANNAYVGENFIMFTRDIPKLRMFASLDRLFDDGRYRKVDLD